MMSYYEIIVIFIIFIILINGHILTWFDELLWNYCYFHHIHYILLIGNYDLHLKMQKQEEMASLPVIMPGQQMPRFIAIPCPCEPPRPEKHDPILSPQKPPKLPVCPFLSINCEIPQNSAFFRAKLIFYMHKIDKLG